MDAEGAAERIGPFPEVFVTTLEDIVGEDRLFKVDVGRHVPEGAHTKVGEDVWITADYTRLGHGGIAKTHSMVWAVPYCLEPPAV